jgi:hypothetical protein
MPNTATGTIPPELHSHYRRVRMRPGQGCSIWFVRLFILPHTLAGLFFLFAMPASVVWAVFGTDHTASAERLWATTSSKGRTMYHVAYGYDETPAGPRHSSDATVSADTYQRLQKVPKGSRTVRVRALGFEPPLFYEAVIEGRGGVWKQVAPIWLFGLFWNGGISVFVYLIYYVPWRQRRLCRSGTPIVGQVVSKRVVRGKSSAYYVRYRFRTPEGGTYEAETSTDKHRYDAVVLDAPAVILYDPVRPRCSVAYDFGLYYYCVRAS